MILSYGIGFWIRWARYCNVSYKTAGANYLESLYRNHRSPHPTVGQGQPMVPLAAALSLAPVHLILVMFTSNKINNNSNSLIKQLLFFPKKNFNQVIWANFISHPRPRHFLNTHQWRHLAVDTGTTGLMNTPGVDPMGPKPTNSIHQSHPPPYPMHFKE